MVDEGELADPGRLWFWVDGGNPAVGVGRRMGGRMIGKLCGNGCRYRYHRSIAVAAIRIVQQ